MLKPSLILIISSLLLIGCGNYKTKTTEIEVDLVAEGPFFAGSNSLIGEVGLNIANLLEDKEFSEIANVTINSISVELEDGQEFSFNDFTSAGIQLVSDNSPMTSIAIMNPIKVTDGELKMTISNEAEVTSFFKEGKFSRLLDLDFVEDSYSEMLKAEVEINVTIEYK